jgi:copper chaperone CopZ
LNMERLNLSVPAMYADHHVLAVRQVLSQLPGVDEVEASSAIKMVRLSYDPARTNPQAVANALEAAGYGSRAISFAMPPKNQDDSSAWKTFIRRITDTNPLDLEMSGDFRKY